VDELQARVQALEDAAVAKRWAPTSTAGLHALETAPAQRHRGIVVVRQGETLQQALAREQPTIPYIVIPAKEPHHAQHP
jgi:hypothetical protein